MSDLQRRSEGVMRGKGYLTASVERRKRFPEKGARPCKACGAVKMLDIAHDLFNCFDFVALRPISDDSGPSRVFVQVTDHTSHSKRRNKIIASNEAYLVLLSGCAILIQSWRKVGNRWQAHDEWISLDQFAFGMAETATQFYEDEARRKMLDRDLPPSASMPLALIPDAEMPF